MAKKSSRKSTNSGNGKSRKYVTMIKLRDGGALIDTIRAESPAQARRLSADKHYKAKVPAGAIISAEIATKPTSRIGQALFNFGGRLSQRALDHL